MSRPVRKDHPIRLYLLDAVLTSGEAQSNLVARAVDRFGVSRQAVHRHLKRLIEEGRISAEGSTQARVYRLEPDLVLDLDLSLTDGEDRVWRDKILPRVAHLPESARDICCYGFTEMLNNVLDHSGASRGAVVMFRGGTLLELRVEDDGVGIFNKIRSELKLEDARHAIFELSKGRLTTDPERHSGEGIFFTSKVFDWFLIWSESITFGRVPGNEELVGDSHEHRKGTTVRMLLDTSTERVLKDVFDEYASSEHDYRFTKTRLIVSLAKHEGVQLVSRSQAKRLLAGCSRFTQIALDFSDVETIGQAFADEVFRVFPSFNPGIRLDVEHANESVARMVRRVRPQQDLGAR